MLGCRSLCGVIAVVAVLSSCGGEAASTSSASDTLPAPSTELSGAAESMLSTPAVPDSRSAGDPATAPELQTVQLDQPAIWPASDVEFETPEEAAESFVSEVLGVDPVLGDYLGGDSRSGEIPVFSPGEGGSAPLLERGLLGLRMIGPNDGWFVIAANSQGVSIESPETLDRVPAGPLTVRGQGRGFEGTVVVTAFLAGDADNIIDQVITSGGAFESLEPYSVSLDLSSGSPGDVIALMVRGDTGLENDPGEFASMPIVIGDPLPETR